MFINSTVDLYIEDACFIVFGYCKFLYALVSLIRFDGICY